MKQTFNRALFALSISILSFDTFAWGQTGHRVTGEIAEHYLTETAAAKIKQILPNESLAEASTWPDEMRSDPDHFWQKVSGPFHYITVPKGKSYKEVGAPSKGDAVTALQLFTQQLKSDKSNLAEKQLALRFIVHIIGDLHQPLHAGNGTDRGGNDLKVRFFWEDSNLHQVWDTGLVDHQKLSYTEWTNWLLQKISKQNIEDWHSTDPLVWIAESIKIRDNIYPEDANNMNWNYAYEHTPTVKMRLSQAGIRIANYLNEVFAD